MAISQQQRTDLLTLLVGMFDAAPGSDLLSALAEGLENGGTLEAYAANLVKSDEFVGIYSNALTSEEFATNFIANLLGSTVTAEITTAAEAFVAGRLNAGESRDAVIIEALTALAGVSEDDADFGAAVAQLNNKVEVAEYFGLQGQFTGLTLSQMQAALSGVTSDDATVVAKKAAIDSGNLEGVGASGDTFTLTAGVDTLNGTSGNDTFTASHATFQATDTIVGGSGTDTLNYVDAGTTGGALPGALVSGVEVINVRNVNGSAAQAATKEVVTLTFSDFTYDTANSSITVDGVTETLSASLTGAQLAALFAANTYTNYDFTSQNGATLVLTAKTAGNVSDLTPTFTSGGGATVVAAPTKAIAQGTDAVASTGVTDTVAASNFAGATNFNSVNSLNDVTFTGLTSGQAVGMTGNGSITNGNVNFTMATSTDAVNVNIAGGTKAGNISYSTGAATSATINSTGAANTVGTVDLANGTLTSVTVNAATNLKGNFLSQATDQVAANGAVTVSGAASSVEFTAALDNDIKTIDASGLTAGGLTATLGTGVTALTGGQGADVITTAATTATGAVINGGAGTDTLVLAATNDVTTAAKAAQYTNFETLRLNDSADASLISGITAIELNAMIAKSVTNLNATQAAAVTVLGDQTTSVSLALKDATGSSDALSITTGNGKGAAFNLGGLIANGFESLTVTTNAKADNADKQTVITSLTADKLTSIDLNGQSVSITNAATTKAVTIDASDLTGNGTVGLDIAGNLVAGSTVTGSAVKDTVALGTAGSTYNTGAGDDAISATALTQLRSGTTYNTINGGEGKDTLTLTANDLGAAMIDDDFKGITNVEKLVFVLNGGTGGESITTGGWYDANFKAAGSDLTITTGAEALTFAGGTFTGAQKLTVTSAATTQDTTLTTGEGADTVSVTAASLTEGDLTVNTGKGNDTITVTVSNALIANSVISVNAGAGKDSITLAGLDAADAQYTTIVVGAGDSTISAYDSVTGFNLGGTASSTTLDFAGTSTVAANVTANSVTGYTSAELTYTISSGVLSFAGTSAAALTLDEKIALADALVATDLATAAFQHGNNTYVYNENATGDSLVELVGVTGVNSLTAGASTSATEIHIA